MKKELTTDWFQKLKVDIIYTALLLNTLEQETVFMLQTNKWILEDINLFETFEHFKEMLAISKESIDDLVKNINLLEDCFVSFNKNDLLDEFEYVKENVNLELSYFNNMSSHIAIVDDFTLDSEERNERLEQYQRTNISCYNQIKINNNQLKILKKERRD